MITKRLPIDELIDREARRLALIDFMHKNSITPDKNLPPNTETEIEILLTTTDIYHTRAKQNILAQKAAHEEALRAIGLNPIEIDPLDIDL